MQYKSGDIIMVTYLNETGICKILRRLRYDKYRVEWYNNALRWHNEPHLGDYDIIILSNCKLLEVLYAL